ncbi:MAG: glutamate-5-semialdehyde dehydrogenase [Erysipelotrichia bacterium]|nr:glutamate-5-semialdehyde dehydrogenase [Erysipelotrichia bacterium]
MDIVKQGKLCKQAAYELMNKTNEEKNSALSAICDELDKQRENILKANQKDIEKAKANHKSDAFIDRLALNDARLDGIIDGVKQVIHLADPTHQILDCWDKGELHFVKKSVPIGVIGIIYEARPNVSVDAASLCLKSGNVCFLRGSSDTIESNQALVKAMQTALSSVSFNPNCIALVQDTSREVATQFMQLNEYLDLLIPRGSANLIKTTVEKASVPIIETGSGNCHVYVDQDADIQKAVDIIINAKTQRVSVCNACESVLVHEAIAKQAMPCIIDALKQHHVKIHGCPRCQVYDEDILLASEIDYAKEYLDYELSIKIVDHIQEAIHHINTYHTQHSDVIISENPQAIETFFNHVDSACVYANASSRFSDGNEFGFGAEIGISTQKIHARGPMGLTALTSYQYQITGNGTIRK